ncbi:MAG: DUF1249 domain-containing protein, partial [Betaproteobacteria bacterium]
GDRPEFTPGLLRLRFVMKPTQGAVSRMSERIYQKLEQLGIVGLIEAKTEAAASTVSGFMDLHFDRLHEHGGAVVIALAHYFEQNGDLCCDPDMQVRVDPARRIAEALTFQQAIPPVYTEVYPEPGKVNGHARQSLNSFLDGWLRNAIAQGHRF